MDELRAALWKNFRRWDGFLALGLGSGLAPRAPGTVGTLAAVPAGAFLSMAPFTVHLAIIVVGFAFGTWICDRVGRRLGVADHGALVWDEFVGYWVALLLLPAHWAWWLAAFLVFRLFDIFKPWPIGPLEHRFGGGFGVMLDDVVAGLMTLVVLWPVSLWLAAPV